MADLPVSMAHKSKDFAVVAVIGALVGILVQPVMSNVLASPSFAIRVAVFVALAILAPVALGIAALLGKFVPVLYQFAKFAAVGVLNTSIDFGVLNLEILLSGITGGLGYSIFKGISFLFATTNSFFWNKYWTFGSNDSVNAAETSKFYVVAVVGWVINVGTASLVVNGFSRGSIDPKIWANVGALCGVATSFLWDFLGYKFLVFKVHATPKETVWPAA